MGECCLTRAGNIRVCSKKNKSNHPHKRMAGFGSVSYPCLVYWALTTVQEGERIRKYPGVQQNAIVAEKKGGWKVPDCSWLLHPPAPIIIQESLKYKRLDIGIQPRGHNLGCSWMLLNGHKLSGFVSQENMVLKALLGYRLAFMHIGSQSLQEIQCSEEHKQHRIEGCSTSNQYISE